MADARWTERIGATPGKLLLVAMLAIVLVAAWMYQVGGSSTAGTPPGPRETRRKPGLPEKPPVAGAQGGAERCETAVVRKISLEEALRHDPFALAGPLAQTVAAATAESKNSGKPLGEVDDPERRVKQAISAVRSKGVKMVVLGRDENLALVGDRPVRVGEMLEGLQVTSITPQGITLSEPNDKQPHGAPEK